jgi:anti-repressor protein
MDELIPIRKSKGGRDVVSARELHQFLEVGSRFDRWFTRRLEEYLFVQLVDYHGPFLDNGADDYVVTLDMAKELCMVERNERGQELRRYFIWAEKKLRALAVTSPLAFPADYATALRQLADSVEDKARLQHQVEQAQQQVKQAQPKVAFFDAVSAASNCIPMAAAAAVLKLPGIGRNKLFRMLRIDGILKRNNAPMQQFINQGYFEVEPNTYDAGKDGEKGKRLATITRVTPRGLQWLSKKYQPQS